MNLIFKEDSFVLFLIMYTWGALGVGFCAGPPPPETRGVRFAGSGGTGFSEPPNTGARTKHKPSELLGHLSGPVTSS